MNNEHIVFIGCGQGRSGTVSLSKLMTGCRVFHCTHEQKPMLSWKFDERSYNNKKQQFLDATMNMGDVHSAYLPYLERFIVDIPDIKIVCSLRDSQEVTDSFERKIGPKTNHWHDHKIESEWQENKLWDPTFPTYEPMERNKAIFKYAEYYRSHINMLAKKYPENILVVDVTELSSIKGQHKIFSFVGVKLVDRLYVKKYKSVHNQTV